MGLAADGTLRPGLRVVKAHLQRWLVVGGAPRVPHRSQNLLIPRGWRNLCGCPPGTRVGTRFPSGVRKGHERSRTSVGFVY
ncbi:MAG: hypothetical protein ACI8W3_000154 [Myxococcota bacterium]|jgi:hypothetical protein